MREAAAGSASSTDSARQRSRVQAGEVADQIGHRLEAQASRRRRAATQLGVPDRAESLGLRRQGDVQVEVQGWRRSLVPCAS